MLPGGDTAVRRVVVRVALAVLGGLTLVTALHVASARRNLLLARAALQVSRQQLSKRNDPAATAGLDRAARDLRAAAHAASGRPLGAVGVIPVVGAPVRAMRAAVRAGAAGVDAGRILVAASSSFPTSASAAVDGTDLSAFHAAAVRSEVAVASVDQRLAAARHLLDGPSGATLPPVSGAARAMRAEIDGSRQELAGVAHGLALLIDLTSPATDTRLLLLSQDSLELRPTGGYIGSYGVIHFSHGAVSLERYEATSDLPGPDPPAVAPYALSRHLPAAWALSNANWWPDFPTSAAAAAEMFRRQGGGEVDGVLALTELATARLLGALGSVQLPGYSEPVTERGFDERVVYEVELKRPLDQPRKKFLVELSNAVFGRLFQLPAERLPAVADAVRRSIGAGDVQLWFVDPGRQAELAGTVVSGQLPRTDGDLLMVVDANMTASKANLDVRKMIDYRVEREADGRLVGHVRIEMRNDGAKSSVNPRYDSYLRIYAPAGAHLLHPDGSQAAEAAPDGPYQVFAQEVVVEPKATGVVTFDYVLPGRVAAGGTYRLTWVRQAGTPSDHLVVEAGTTRAEGDPARRLLRVITRIAR